MKKLITKPSAIIFLILLSTSIFANKTPNYPKGFSPKTNNGISFTENKGQVHDQNYKSRPDVLFGGSDGNLVFHLKNNGISYQLNRVDTWKKESDLIKNNADAKILKDDEKLVADQTTIYRLDINWLNANTNAELIKQNPLDGFNNYYSENCPNGPLNVKSYQQITFQNIYDGIDLKWYEKDGHLEYDYLVNAGADYKQIQLEIKGADKITLNNKGELIYKTPLGDIIEQAPLVKQNGKTLKSKWIITNNVLSFEIENINKSEAFIIDPVVRTWGTYYGGTGADYGSSCSTDVTGNVYMAGYTTSTSGIATTGAHQTAHGGGGYDAFLVKFNSAGIRLWGTYYGGNGDTKGQSCTTDASGNVYMAGWSNINSGTSIATSGSHQSSNTAYYDCFLVKFNSAGIRQWGTYYGGPDNDYPTSCSTDASGNVYMVGNIFINSGTFIATIGSHQSAFGGGNADAFLVKFNSAGIRQWGTYYGGGGTDYGHFCATDASGNIYLTGFTTTNSGTIIATSGSHQSAFGGSGDAFLVKFNSAGIRQWGTYYGGTGSETGYSCATDASGNVYIRGVTDTPSGTVISTSGSHQSAFGGGNADSYLVKFNSAGIRQWGTYYGGSGDDYGWSSSTDASGNVYMAGETTSTLSIATAGAHQAAYGAGNYDAFLVKFNSAGVRQWGTYYGGTGSETGYSCATDASGNVYMAGETSSTISIATSGSHQSAFGGGTRDAYLVKFNECLSPTITVNSGAICAGQSFTINPTGANTYSIQGGNAVVSPSISTNYTVIGTSVAGCTNTTVSAVTVNPNPTITVNNGTICAGQNFTINPNGANTYTIQGGNAVVSPPSNASFTVAGTSTAGCLSQAFATSNLIVNQNPTITVNNGAICVGQNFTINPNGANTYTIQGGSAVVSPPSNASYTVIGTNSVTGCRSQVFATSSLTVNPNPTITVNSGAICAGQNFTINPNGANTYTIQGGSAVVSPPSNTSYTVIGTNSITGCRSQVFATSSLTVNPNPTITVNSGAICAGQNFTINPNGANTYTIQGGNAVVSPPSNSSYTVIGTNSVTGCRSQAFATSNLIVNQNPTITVNNGAICAGQNFTINTNGANTYTIQGGNAVVSPAINSSYTVAGTSTSGCKSQGFATSNLTVNLNPTITVNSGAICAGQNFTINPNGANIYTIQGGNAVVSPAINSSYTVAGTSTSGCKSQGFATSNLTVNANPTITVNSGFICAGENFTIYPNGANTYSIQGGNAVVSPTSNASYTVAGTNSAGCVSQAFATSSLTVNQCVGVTNQNIALGGVSIYPNPNNGEFTIELVSVNYAYITITNVLGQIIKSQKAELINQIDLNAFDKGIYFINVMDNNQSVYRGSIIKQ